MRPLLATDAPALHALIRRSETADGIPVATTIEEVEELFETSTFDPFEDARVVEAGGDIVGYGRLWHIPSGVRLERVYLIGVIDPGHRTRGLGRVMLDWQIERATEILAGYDHDLPRFIRAQAYEWQTDVDNLYRRAGLTPVRWIEELLRDLAHLPPVVPPPGITLVPWRPEHQEPARQVSNSAFADHWGSTPRSVESWNETVNEFGVRLDLSWVAMNGDEVVGVVLNSHYPGDEAISGRLDGWIDLLAVLAGWRRRGVASALVNASLEAFREAGLTHAMIGVDGDNPTGASRLYRSLGFEVRYRSVTYQLEVAPEARPSPTM
jgi:ribosomal protein S18 acetylase RimI-like enzyme